MAQFSHDFSPIAVSLLNWVELSVPPIISDSILPLRTDVKTFITGTRFLEIEPPTPIAASRLLTHRGQPPFLSERNNQILERRKVSSKVVKLRMLFSMPMLS